MKQKQKQISKREPRVNPLHGQFDGMVDAVLGAPEKTKNSLVKNKATVATWSVPLQDIYDNKDMRLDASHYDRQTAAALQELRESGFPLIPLSELAAVNLPGQFTRIWAKDEKHGLPYINATDLMSMMGIGMGVEMRFLSRETNVDIEELIIRKGWLLMSCSGTIGRLFYVPERIDGWVATHDLIRIIPHDGVEVGFLHAYLSSTIAQIQILGHTHGGQIDHVTHHQVGGVLVPKLPADKTKELHKRTMQALREREETLSKLAAITDDVQKTIITNHQSRK